MAEVERRLVGLRALPEEERKRGVRDLLLRWHPDKNPPEKQLSATHVFQFIQSKKEEVLRSDH